MAAVKLFAVQVGARRYCLRSVSCYCKKLSLNNTLIRNTIKKISKSYSECSFCILLSRDNKDSTPAANCDLNDSRKKICNSPSSMSSLKQTTKPVSNAKSILPLAFLNKSNTC